MSKATTLSMTVVVARKHRIADGIVHLVLEDPHGRELPPFTAGAHLDVQAGGQLRQYSLCNDPADRHRYELGILREPESRGGSRFMHEELEQGDYLQISAPRNHFELEPSAGKTLLFAGGIGVTPILAMSRHLAATKQTYEFHYSARSREHMAFLDELEEGPLAAHAHLHFDDEPDTRLDLTEAVNAYDASTHVYVCGPGGYIDFVLGSFKEAGWPAEQLHREYFSVDAIDTRGDGSFEVVLAKSNLTLTVPADETVADVLIDNDIDLLTSCEQGICGTCLTRVLEGEPDHRDHYLTEAEQAANDRFTPCCSRSKSPRLVLDL